MGLLAQMRSAVKRSTETPASIARVAKLPKSALTRLLQGRGMTIENAEKLARALGLRIKIEPRKRRKG